MTAKTSHGETGQRTAQAATPEELAAKETDSPSDASVDLPERIGETSETFIQAQDVLEIQADRRWFHMHPELSGREYQTAERIATRLKEAGVDDITHMAETGVCAWIRGSLPGKTILLRADMDAYPVEEADRGQSYRSQAEGAHHACGHDAHMAILLGVARVLARTRTTLNGNYVLVFQPAEEFGGGARRCIESRPWPEDLEPDHSLGLHIWNELPVGTVDVTTGAVMCGAKSFEVTFEGNGGHAAEPHLTKDPIVCAAAFVSGLQTLVSRELAPTDVGLVTVARTSAGTSQYSRIADQAFLGGTIRAMEPDILRTLSTRVREFASATGAAFGLRTSVSVSSGGYPPCTNDPAVTQLVSSTAAGTIGPDNVSTGFRTCGSDDMSEFLQRYPGCYFFLGGRGLEQDSTSRAHTPAFDFDERALETGAKVLAASALSLATQKRKDKW